MKHLILIPLLFAASCARPTDMSEFGACWQLRIERNNGTWEIHGLVDRGGIASVSITGRGETFEAAKAAAMRDMEQK